MKLIAAFALAAALLAGCSDGGSQPKTPPMEDGKYVISMQGTQFVPNDATVPVGATVVWVNREMTPHDVTAKDGSWTSDTQFTTKMQRDDRYERTFTEAGTVEYFCEVHDPTMTAKLVVQ